MLLIVAVAYRWVHIDVQVRSPGEIQRIKGSYTKRVRQGSDAILYRWRLRGHRQEFQRKHKISGHLKETDCVLPTQVECSHPVFELDDHRSHTMYAGHCHTLIDVLGACRLIGGPYQEPHSDAISSWLVSVQHLAWKEAIFATSSCVQMLGFCAHSQIETNEAKNQSTSRLIRLVPHISWTICGVCPIGLNTSLLETCIIQRMNALHSPKYCRRSDLEWALLQRCHQRTQSHRDAINWMSNRVVIGPQITNIASAAKEEVMTIGWARKFSWRGVGGAWQRKSSEPCWQGYTGRDLTTSSRRWGIHQYDSHLHGCCYLQHTHSWG